MKHAVETGSGAMVYIRSLINIASGIQKLIGGIHRQHGDVINLLFCLLSYFEKIELGLWDHVAVRVCIPLVVARQRLRFLCGPRRIKEKEATSSSQNLLYFFKIRKIAYKKWFIIIVQAWMPETEDEKTWKWYRGNNMRLQLRSQKLELHRTWPNANSPCSVDETQRKEHSRKFGHSSHFRSHGVPRYSAVV
jgi:hypothetical protein